MATKELYIKYYEPLIAEFCKRIENIGIAPNIKAMPEPFFNYFGKSYTIQSPKIVFIGQDTKWWGDLNSFLLESKKSLSSKLVEHFDSFEKHEFINWGSNRYTFWGFVLLFLASLNGKKDEWESLKSGEYPEILDTFAWANCEPIEYYNSTAAGLGIPKEYWENVREAGRVFYGFEHVLKTLNPDIAIILHNIGKDNDYFSGLNLSEVNDDDLTHFKVNNTNIFVLPHPSHMRFTPERNADFYCDLLVNRIKNRL